MLNRIQLEQPLAVEYSSELPEVVERVIEMYGDTAELLRPGFYDLTPKNSGYTILDSIGIKVIDETSAVSRLRLHTDSNALSIDVSSGNDTERNVMRIPQDCDSIIVLGFFRRNIYRRAGKLSLFDVIYPEEDLPRCPLQQIIVGDDATPSDLRKLHDIF